MAGENRKKKVKRPRKPELWPVTHGYGAGDLNSASLVRATSTEYSRTPRESGQWEAPSSRVLEFDDDTY
jgi:hypothetical protein